VDGGGWWNDDGWMDEEERLGLGRRNQGHDPCHSAVLPKISLLQTPPGFTLYRAG